MVWLFGAIRKLRRFSHNVLEKIRTKSNGGKITKGPEHAILTANTSQCFIFKT